jgi:nephrocystin-3
MAETAAAPESREIRVFLSSTFRDFNEERKLLATQVFPELNRRARQRGVELVEVDLRWGVTQEQAEDGQALEICLREIERCKLYFIGMLGDSYGSLTPPQRQLLQASSKLLEQRQWLAGRFGEASYTELEIEQRLQQIGGNASDGRAFFYFRDPAWSDPRAEAGEPGWRSDDSADRQKLELLRERIRSSGYPLMEGLKNPQAIADQIKADLWALIDRQFPESEHSDALQKEERKHADYRRSRTGADQYIGGEGYIEQLDRWIEEGQQKILITGESGAGKSALVANWMERRSQSHPADVVYAHHLGCTNDANALRPMLGRLIDTTSALLLEAGVILEALAVPEEWWELVAKVAETLQALGCWCQQHGKRWIWVLDGLDRLDPDDQKALPWLPQTLPNGVQVVVSALTCPAREILDERGYTTLTIQPLEEKEQEQLILRYLKRYTKELEGGLRQQILNHPLAGSPLFLKVLLEELRQCGRHDTLKDQLAFYLSSQTVDDLYERVLERLENDGSGEAVRKVMTALWASRAGLTEPELLAITDLKPLQWAPIDLALEKAFGRNGNRLVFDHDYLRIAVRDRYLPSEEQQRQAHGWLADWYQESEGWNTRKAEELPWQMQKAERVQDLKEMLLDVHRLCQLADHLDDREVINYWRAAKREGDGELDELIAEAVQEGIEKRKEDPADQICFVNCIAALLSEAGLYRELLLELRTLSLELEEATDGREEASLLSSLAWRASAHRDTGQYNEAETLYLRCLEASERQLGPEHPSTLRTIGNLGLLYSKTGDYAQAEASYTRCLEASERLQGPEHPDTLTTVDNLAGHYSVKGDYEQAESFYMRCLEAHERLLGPEHASTLITVNNLGLLYSKKGDYEQAEAYYNRCLEARERLLGPEHPSTLPTVNNLGLLYSQKGDYDKAEAFYTRCLEASERLLGPEHPDTLTTVDNLAGLFQDKGDYEQAEVYYRRCLEARERLLGPEHPDTSSTRLSLAIFLSDQERYSESIPLLRQGLGVAAKRDGREARSTHSLIHRLAQDLYWVDELEESEQLYRKALSGRIAALGNDNGATMASRFGLARCLSKQERYSEAIELRRVELALLQASYDVDVKDMLISMHGLGCDLQAAGETEEALEVLRSCLREREEALGADHADTLRTAYTLADVLSQQERRAEAIPLRRRELAWRRQVNGDTDPGTLSSINYLALDLCETGALEEAEDLFRELLETRQQVLEPNDLGIDRALGGLAKTLEEAGKLEEAAAFAQQALDHRLAHEDLDAWWTNRRRLDMARVHSKLQSPDQALILLDALQASITSKQEPDADDQQLLADAAELRLVIETQP